MKISNMYIEMCCAAQQLQKFKDYKMTSKYTQNILIINDKDTFYIEDRKIIKVPAFTVMTLIAYKQIGYSWSSSELNIPLVIKNYWTSSVHIENEDKTVEINSDITDLIWIPTIEEIKEMLSSSINDLKDIEKRYSAFINVEAFLYDLDEKENLLELWLMFYMKTYFNLEWEITEKRWI